MTLRLNGSTSGYTEINSPAVGGNNTVLLPSSNGSANQFLKNGSTAGTLGWSSLVEDSSGRVGIGTASPGSLNVYANQVVVGNGSGSHGITLHTGNGVGDQGSIFFADGTTGASQQAAGFIYYGHNTDSLVFGTVNTERMRIRNAGNVLINQTSATSGNSHEITAVSVSQNDFGWFVNHPATDTAVRCIAARSPNYGGDSGYFFIGARSTGDRIYILTSGNVQNTNNSYGAISDLKLKKDIEPAGSQWEDIKALRVQKFRFKDDPEGPKLIGLIAQEAEQVSPGLIEESKDFDKDGHDLGTVTKAVKYSVLYMKAVKALQEAMERIETLEASNADLAARLAALEAQS